jgi:hypothetical protein
VPYNKPLNLLIIAKLFDSGLRKGVRKATCPSGGVGSSNHTAGGASGSTTMMMVFAGLFVLCVAVTLVICRKVPEHNLKVHIFLSIRLICVTFSHWCAPYLHVCPLAGAL